MKEFKSNYQANDRRYIAVLVILLLALIALLVTLYALSNKTDEPALSATTTQSEKSNSIAIPGYEALHLEADVQKQKIALSNPSQNSCYFQITLSLEDGTILWESQMIAPGETSQEIVLTQSLKKGTYTGAKLIYRCFQMNADFTPINGAETILTLMVK